MRISVPGCQVCKDAGFIANDSRQWASITDGRVYEYSCEHGHCTILNHQAYEFQVLFEIGCQAILDGYHREAVASFNSALERFYEFYIRAILISRSSAQSESESCWRVVKSSSERQLGAFTYVYLVEEGVAPLALDELPVGNTRKKQFKSFRNNVVHGGTIPTREQALSFGQIVLDFIVPIYRNLSYKVIKGTEENLMWKVFDLNADKLWALVEQMKESKIYDSEVGGTLPMILLPGPYPSGKAILLKDYLEVVGSHGEQSLMTS